MQNNDKNHRSSFKRRSSAVESNNVKSIRKLGEIIKENDFLFQDRTTLPTLVYSIINYLISLINLILIGIAFSKKYISYFEFVLYIAVFTIFLVFSIFNHFHLFRNRNSCAYAQQLAKQLMNYRTQIRFPYASRIERPSSMDVYPTYRDRTWQAVPVYFLIPGDVIDVANLEIPSFASPLSRNMWTAYPRSGYIEAENNVNNLLKDESSPFSPKLYTVLQSPLILHQMSKYNNVSNVQKLYNVMFSFFAIFVLLFIALIPMTKNWVLSGIHVCMPYVVVSNFLFIQILRKLSLYLIDEKEKPTNQTKQPDLEASSGSSWSTKDGYSDDVFLSTSDFIDDFYYSPQVCFLQNMSYDCPEQIALVSCLTFPRFHPLFRLPFMSTSSVLVFDQDEEIVKNVDLSYSFDIIPPLNKSNVTNLYRNQLNAIGSSALQGSWNKLSFDPLVVCLKKWNLSQISYSMQYFGIATGITSSASVIKEFSIVHVSQSNLSTAQVYYLSDQNRSILVSKGDPSIVFSLCSTYWNGSSLVDIDQNFLDKLNHEIDEVKRQCHGTPFAITNYLLDGPLIDDTPPKSIFTFEDLPPSIPRCQTLLGVVMFSKRTSPEAEDLVTNMQSLGIRFSIFSEYDGKESLTTMGKLGFPTDFNCVIDLSVNSPSDIYDTLDVQNTHMPVGVENLISYVDTHDSIPLTVPLYLNADHSSMVTVLNMRAKHGQNICIMCDPYHFDGFSLGNSYKMITIDSNLIPLPPTNLQSLCQDDGIPIDSIPTDILRSRSDEALTNSLSMIHQVGKLVSNHAFAHFSSDVPLDFLSDFFLDCRHFELHMRLAIYSFFVSQLMCILPLFILGFFNFPISLINCFIASFFIIPFLSYLSLKSPKDLDLSKSYPTSSGIIPKMMIIMGCVQVALGTIAYIVWKNIFGITKWWGDLFMIISCILPIIVSSDHPHKLVDFSDISMLIYVATFIDLIVIAIHGLVDQNLYSVLFGIGIQVLDLIAAIILKRQEALAESDRQQLYHLDFTTRLGAFSPDRIL